MLQTLKVFYNEHIILWEFFVVLTFGIAIIQMLLKLLKLNNKLQLSTQRVDYLESCNKTVSGLYDNVRSFKHDFNNIVQILGGYICMNDVDGLKKYYKNLTKDYEKVKNYNLINLNEINNPAIYSLLSQKYNYANEHEIKMNISLFADLKNLNVNMYEYGRILGILLDNAFEAAESCEQKIVNVKFFEDNITKNINCSIENTYLEKNVNIDKIFEKNYSTKSIKGNRGLGLWEVGEIIKRNEDISLETKKDNYIIH